MSIVILVLLQVFSRILRFSIPFGSELASFFFLWMIFMGAPLAIENRGHYYFDNVIQKLPRKAQLVLRYIVDIIVLFISILLFYHGMRYAVIGWGRYTTALRWRFTWVLLSIPVGSFFMVINTIINIKKIRYCEFDFDKGIMGGK